MSEISFLSRGTYGAIYTVDENTIIKRQIVDVDPQHPPLNEVDILRQVSPHPGVVCLKDVSISRKFPSCPKLRQGERMCDLNLTLERAKTNLDKHIIGNRGMSLCDVRSLGFQLFNALHHIHLKGFLHLDIHPMNILLFDNKRYAFCDFGMGAPIAKDNKNRSLTGVHPYFSPERMLYDNLTEKSDIWSLGCVLFYCLNDEHVIDRYLQDDDNNVDLNFVILRIDYTLKNILNKDIDDEDLRDLLLKILQVNPKLRPSTSEVLQHRFFKDVGGRGESSDREAVVLAIPSSLSDEITLSPLPKKVSGRISEMYNKWKWKKWFSCRALFMGLDIFIRLPEGYQDVSSFDVCLYIALNYILKSVSIPRFDKVFSGKGSVSREKIQNYVSMEMIPIHRRHLEIVFDSHDVEITPIIFYKIYLRLRDQSKPVTYDEIYKSVMSS